MPKRKMREDSDVVTEVSPPKRATRASARLNSSGLAASSTPSRSTSNSPKKVIQRNSKRFQADVQLGPSMQSARPLRTRRTQSAARQSPLKKTNASLPSTRNGKQNSNLIPSPQKQEVPDNSDDADELNLSPHKLPDNCTTPPPRSHVGRVLMHSVEISTPRLFPKITFTASPGPSTRQYTAKTPTATTGVAYHAAELAPASPSRPQNVLPPQTSPNRTNQLPSTPIKDRLQSKSPKKDQPPASRPQSPTRIPRNLPSHLGTCLFLQKRAMLLELQNCIMECNEDSSLGPTNTATSQQLKDLLAGTVTRGEGNSCFVLGPRGSGKTAVRCPYLPVV
jgi:origin recognition complex subunit 4